MAVRVFRELLQTQWDQEKFVCVGLDTKYEKIPSCVRTSNIGKSILDFNRAIIGTTCDLVCAYKLNIAFYEAHGVEGWQALHETIQCVLLKVPNVPIIVDAKRADIGNTNLGYAREVFDCLEADAITVNPYLGGEALQPFLDRTDKGVIILCRTSNPDAGEFQDLQVNIEMEEGEFLREVKARPSFNIQEGYTTQLFKHVAYRVSCRWNKRNNCAVVVGATCSEELGEVRHIVGDMPILIPGVGAQGSDVKKTVAAGVNSKGQGIVVNSSRGIIFASSGTDFAEAARRETEKLHDLVNQHRKEK